MALAVDIQPSLLTSPRLLDKGKMIDFDVPLDGVVGLALPYAGGFLQTQVVSQRQLSQPDASHGVHIVDDDFGSHVVPVLIAFRQDRPDVFLLHILGIDVPGLMGDDDRLALVGGKAFRSEDLFREPQLPPF